jgi:ribosome-associated protein
VGSQLTRDQGRNLDDARSKLAELVRLALHRPKVRRATKPSRGAKERRISDKKKTGEKKAQRRSAGD